LWFFTCPVPKIPLRDSLSRFMWRHIDTPDRALQRIPTHFQ
jgi:hypothetical protein